MNVSGNSAITLHTALERKEAEVKRLQAELNEAQELILDLFRQACLTPESVYDHMYITWRYGDR